MLQLYGHVRAHLCLRTCLLQCGLLHRLSFTLPICPLSQTQETSLSTPEFATTSAVVSITTPWLEIPRGIERKPDEIELIPRRDIKLLREIGSGPGYLLHSGTTRRGRAVIVKAFRPHPNAQERLEATLAMSRMLMHSNVLQVEGISFPSSIHHFITYEDVHWKNADGPLAAALKDDGDRSLRLAFTMVAGFAAGLDYLDVQGLAVGNMKVHNFDVFLDINDRFVLSVNPEWTSTDIVSDEHPADGTAWDLFNALCAKVLRSANHVIHAKEIERDPVAVERLPSMTGVPGQKLPLPVEEYGGAGDADRFSIPGSITRREYVWRDIDHETNSLSDVATRMSLDRGFELAPVNRLTWADTKSPHRCPGYVREEITVATSKAASAIVSRDAPGPLEICPICGEVVSRHEKFSCVCGDPYPGARPTIKCIVCKNWSHAHCVGNLKEYICQACMYPQGEGEDFSQLLSPFHLPPMTQRAQSPATDFTFNIDYVDSSSEFVDDPTGLNDLHDLSPSHSLRQAASYGVLLPPSSFLGEVIPPGGPHRRTQSDRTPFPNLDFHPSQAYNSSAVADNYSYPLISPPMTEPQSEQSHVQWGTNYLQGEGEDFSQLLSPSSSGRSGAGSDTWSIRPASPPSLSGYSLSSPYPHSPNPDSFPSTFGPGGGSPDRFHLDPGFEAHLPDESPAFRGTLERRGSSTAGRSRNDSHTSHNGDNRRQTRAQRRRDHSPYPVDDSTSPPDATYWPEGFVHLTPAEYLSAHNLPDSADFIVPSTSSSAAADGASSPSASRRDPSAHDVSLYRTAVTDATVIASKNRRREPTKRGKFICNLCGSDFTAKHNLKNHVNSHSKTSGARTVGSSLAHRMF
ncbi:hypothetical protein B0H16DRAFT_351141 [Mycena metata]|uniref:C2H2-type domain-containing protein n=1 Tax=Mycena metata TaxID=1033252 RepID=A0AAD7JKZ1_9AGAR|nr:hypothetical protein B0H16DRAFT_351141 [Mycena metata]